MAVTLVFPGQGSQEVGMGKSLCDAFPVAKAVFDEVDDALGEKLSKVMFDGPMDELTLTQNAQPALMAVSMAALAVLKSERGLDLAKQVKFVAGHSLGEYSALAAAEAFTLADAARLLRLRGLAMQAAVPVGAGAMSALLGVGLDVAKTVAAAAAGDDVCDVANDNEPTQVVLSGHAAALKRVGEIAKEHGVRRAVPLPVSAPFHCSLMQPAADAMAEALDQVVVSKPVVPVIANVTAEAIDDPDDIKKRLVEQVVDTVRWRECVQYMAANGITDIMEVGCGKVLAGLVRRTHRDFNAVSVGSPDDIDKGMAIFAS
ncbi:MAG: ACP S-malonyltransferase [Pseudomonadota bacterium]